MRRGASKRTKLGSERPMVCTSAIVADHDPLVVSGVNSTLGAATDSDMAASCGDELSVSMRKRQEVQKLSSRQAIQCGP
jgi:hypothetical protein